MKPVREPDAGKLHVRFDEEGRETRDGPFGEWTPAPKGRKRWGAAGPVHDRARPSLYVSWSGVQPVQAVTRLLSDYGDCGGAQVFTGFMTSYGI